MFFRIYAKYIMFQSILVLDHILPFRSFIFSFIPKFGSCRTKPEKGVYDGQRWKENQSKKKTFNKKKQAKKNIQQKKNKCISTKKSTNCHNITDTT